MYVYDAVCRRLGGVALANPSWGVVVLPVGVGRPVVERPEMRASLVVSDFESQRPPPLVVGRPPYRVRLLLLRSCVLPRVRAYMPRCGG